MNINDNKLTVEEAKTIIEDFMKDIGTYNDSFEISISFLAKLLLDYKNINDEWIAKGSRVVSEHTNKNGSTNIVKDPLYQSMEKLRMDILTYLKELGLTPSGLKKLKQNSFENSGSASKFDELILKVLK